MQIEQNENQAKFDGQKSIKVEIFVILNIQFSKRVRILCQEIGKSANATLSNQAKSKFG